ncbi:hypothetical protein HDV00_007441 [Rhizophlyctis rosea]|nr:hypothetical protein HDV00_007441 [Rhizophlyctis rosea]
MSGINALGRILCGQVADKVGRINTEALVVFLSGLSCLAVWIVAKSEAVLWGFVVLYGLTGGAFWALTAVVTAEVVGLKDLPNALSLVMLTTAPPLILSGPITSAIYEHTGESTYVPSIAFAGCALCVGALCLLGAKWEKNPKWWAKA